MDPDANAIALSGSRIGLLRGINRVDVNIIKVRPARGSRLFHPPQRVFALFRPARCAILHKPRLGIQVIVGHFRAGSASDPDNHLLAAELLEMTGEGQMDQENTEYDGPDLTQGLRF